MTDDALLEVSSVSVFYDQIQALETVSLRVRRGEIVVLAGTNGAGKSTLLRAISGLVKVRAGEVRFKGRRIDGLSAHKIVRAGLAHVPEGRRIFPRFSVIENLRIGAYARGDFGRAERDARSRLEELPILQRRAAQLGGQLSGGEQQLLAINRALMSSPEMLMLDEPSMGLSPMLADQMLDLVVQLNRSGTTVLLVEQNARGALEIAHRGYVLSAGRVTMSGTGGEMLADPAFIKAYMATGEV